MTTIVAHTQFGEFVALHGTVAYGVEANIAAYDAAKKLEKEYSGKLHNGHVISVYLFSGDVVDQNSLDQYNRANPPQHCNYIGQPN